MLKYPEMCTMFLDISRLIFQNIWKLSLLHKHMFPDKGKNNPWPSYVKKLFHDKYQKNFMISIRKHYKKSNICNNTKKHIFNKLDKKQQIKH